MKPEQEESLEVVDLGVGYGGVDPILDVGGVAGSVTQLIASHWTQELKICKTSD